MFYTIDGVWQLRKLKSNWKYISLTVKYPTHTRKIFYTIILPSNYFHFFENSSPHSLSSLTPSPSRRTKKATVGEAQIQSSTHGPTIVPASLFAGEGSFSSTPPSSSLFHSPDPSVFLPQFRLASIWAHPLTLNLSPIPHPRHHCLKWFFIYLLYIYIYICIYCKITFVLGFWRINGCGDSWVSMVVGWEWV